MTLLEEAIDLRDKRFKELKLNRLVSLMNQREQYYDFINDLNKEMKKV